MQRWALWHASHHRRPTGRSPETRSHRGPMTRTSSSALEEIRTPNLLIRSNHAYCDVLNEICAVQPTGRANRTRNSQMLSVRRPRALYGPTYGARSITAWLIAGSQRSRSSSRSTITPPNHCGPVTSSHRCLVVGGYRKLRWRPAGTSGKRPRIVVASRDLTRASWAQIAESVLDRHSPSTRSPALGKSNYALMTRLPTTSLHSGQ